MNLTDDQAKGLHKAFWMFCQKQRRMQRLQRLIKHHGSWEQVPKSSDPRTRALMEADHRDLSSRRVKEGNAIRMLGLKKDALFNRLELAVIAGRTNRAIITLLFEDWRRCAGGAKLSRP